MLILGIESSCDETSLALLEGDYSGEFLESLNGFKVVSSVISSQVDTHIKFGGVVPEIGARLHAQQIHFLFELLCQNYLDKVSETVWNIETDELRVPLESKLEILGKIDRICVTTEPGLVSALRVGQEFAKTVRFFIGQKFGKMVEIENINHLSGHVISSFFGDMILPDSEVFPHVHLIVSGGNSQLLLIQSPNEGQIVGRTLDDAAGECLDKIGRMLGFPYPGGLNLAKVAGLDAENYADFSVGMLKNDGLDYSFSGLKTAVRLYLLNRNFELEKALTDEEIGELRNKSVAELSGKLKFIKETAISAQYVVVKQLTNKLNKAIYEFGPNSIGFSGGVSANKLLREEIQNLVNLPVFKPKLELTGDNAIMIVLAGIAKKYKN
jgi:N6-L-threonylcarbamoyladenine synthase